MKKIVVLLGMLVLSGCATDQDDVVSSDNSIKNFVYRGLNSLYLYKAEVPDLADDRFASVAALEEYHTAIGGPQDFFNVLLHQPQTIDRFSVLVEDYVAFENLLNGQQLSNGMEFGLVAEENSTTNIFGYVRYAQPNSNAAQQGVARGMIFNQINGAQLTRTNFRELLALDDYTLGLADYNNGVITSNGSTIDLSKSVLQENPILSHDIIDIPGKKVGYLMYNSFLSQFDDQVNQVFADFRGEGIDELVLDLRYNGGGSVNSAIMLGSLIANEPTSSVFSTEEWNPDLQAAFQQNQPDRLINHFVDRTITGTALNSLNISRLYVITTGSTASASELVINGLDPYMDVVTVGTNTAGKFQASITAYDSPSFSRNNVNPGHRYAMQPLIFKTLNSAGVTDFFNGFTPDIMLQEDFGNLGLLGAQNEPLLRACLDHITLNPIFFRPKNNQADPFTDSQQLLGRGQRMWK